MPINPKDEKSEEKLKEIIRGRSKLNRETGLRDYTYETREVEPDPPIIGAGFVKPLNWTAQDEALSNLKPEITKPHLGPQTIISPDLWRQVAQGSNIDPNDPMKVNPVGVSDYQPTQQEMTQATTPKAIAEERDKKGALQSWLGHLWRTRK